MASDRAKRTIERLKSFGATEQVVYRPNAGTPREVTATVDREGMQDALTAVAPGFNVTVLNDESDGISTSLMDAGADRIDVAERFGGAAETRGIQRVIHGDDDFLTVEVT